MTTTYTSSRLKHRLGKVLATFVMCILISACAPKVERDFKQSCKAMGGNRSFCSCVYEQLEDHYGLELLKQVGDFKRLPPADLEQRTQQYGASCMHKLQ